MEKEYVELTELLGFLREAVEGNFPERFWVKAEISSLSVKANGHCYMELCQSEDGVLKAKVRATAWRSRWVFIKEMFRTVTGSEMAVGMEILAKVQVVFHEVYGLSLNIEDVDPDFTLGAKEKKRQETIARLEKEGLFELQKRLRLTALPYSLAVISARGAAGLGDFRRHLLENEYGFVFDVSPPLNTTAPFGMPNASASVSISSLFALPSTGAQRMRTFTASPSRPSIPARELRGWALTLRMIPSGVSV